MKALLNSFPLLGLGIIMVVVLVDAGARRANREEEARAYDLWHKYCANESPGGKSEDGASIHCKRIQDVESRRETKKLDTGRGGDEEPATDHVILVQPPTLNFTHDLELTRGSSQLPKTVIYVKPAKVDHHYNTNIRNPEQAGGDYKPEVVFLSSSHEGSQGQHSEEEEEAYQAPIFTPVTSASRGKTKPKMPPSQQRPQTERQKPKSNRAKEEEHVASILPVTDQPNKPENMILPYPLGKQVQQQTQGQEEEHVATILPVTDQTPNAGTRSKSQRGPQTVQIQVDSKLEGKIVSSGHSETPVKSQEGYPRGRPVQQYAQEDDEIFSSVPGRHVNKRQTWPSQEAVQYSDPYSVVKSVSYTVSEDQ